MELEFLLDAQRETSSYLHCDAIESADQQSMLGGMFSFMRRTKKIRHQPEAGGIYLDDLDMNQIDPEVAALYFPKYQSLHGNILTGEIFSFFYFA